MERKVSLDDKSPEMLDTLANIFDDLQTTLEPVRDKALDERARLIGYAQCAEQMIKMIAEHALKLRGMAKTKREAAKKAELEVAAKPTKTRTKTVKETAKEVSEGGNNTA